MSEDHYERVRVYEGMITDLRDALHGLVGDDGVLTELGACQCNPAKSSVICRVCDARNVFMQTGLALQEEEHERVKR